MAANAADPYQLAAVTLKKHWQLATSALPVTIGRLEVRGLFGSGLLTNTSGHSLSEGRIQAQWALRAKWWPVNWT